MIAPGTRASLIAFGGLTLLAFVALFVLSSKTDHYFAWTIKPPATAAFLGAAYGAGCVLVVLGLRSGRWSLVRAPYTVILIFTVVTLIATLLHLDRFHFGSTAAVARFAAWFWLAIYVLVPIAMTVALVAQERRPRAQPSRRQGLPSHLAVPLAVQGAALGAVGISLFVAPVSARSLWPWTLTELTARMVAAWLIAFGIAAVLVLRQADVADARTLAWAYAVLGALELVVALRYLGSFRWDSVSAWCYVLLASSILAVSARALARELVRPDGASHRRDRLAQ